MPGIFECLDVISFQLKERSLRDENLRIGARNAGFRSESLQSCCSGRCANMILISTGSRFGGSCSIINAPFAKWKSGDRGVFFASRETGLSPLHLLVLTKNQGVTAISKIFLNIC